MKKRLSLLYHDVISDGNYQSSGFPDKDAFKYKMDVNTFKNQLKTLRTFLDSGADHTIPKMIHTFDDGGKSAITMIAPLLEEHGFKGMFFIPTSFIGKEGFLNEADIKSLSDRGHGIGSHTHNHVPMLDDLKYKDVIDEWIISRKILEDITGKHIYACSLPGGWFSNKIAIAASEASYTEMFTSKPVIDSFRVANVYIYGRFNIDEAADLNAVPHYLANKGHIREQELKNWERRQLLKVGYPSLYLSLRKMYKSIFQ